MNISQNIRQESKGADPAAKPFFEYKGCGTDDQENNQGRRVDLIENTGE